MKFKYRKIIYIASFSIMFLGMILFSTSYPSFDTKGNSMPSVPTGSAIQVQNTVSTGAAVSIGDLKKDAYPEVNLLISDYFKAKLTAQEAEIRKYVDNIQYVGIDKLPRIVDKIEKVEGIHCYTIDGPEENAYIVYVYNEVKFKNVNTKSTALDGFYVKKIGDGGLKIILEPVAKEVQQIIEESSKRKDVQALIEDVNTKFTNEIKSDKDLASLIRKLTEGTDDKEDGTVKKDKKQTSEKKKKKKS